RRLKECLCNVVHEEKIERFFTFARNDNVTVGRSLPWIQRAGAEIDDAVVTSQCFRAEQSGNGWRTFQQPVMDEPFQLNDTHFFADDVHGADGQLANMRHTHPALLQVDSRGTIWRLASGNSHAPDKGPMQHS